MTEDQISGGWVQALVDDLVIEQREGEETVPFDSVFPPTDER